MNIFPWNKPMTNQIVINNNINTHTVSLESKTIMRLQKIAKIIHY